jgi:hypothetical protein
VIECSSVVVVEGAFIKDYGRIGVWKVATVD